MAIISFSRKFVFLKTRKVAGTSVEALVRPYLGEADIVPAVTPRDEFYCASRGAFSRNYLASSANERKYTELVLQKRFEDAANFLQTCRKRASSHMTYRQIQKVLENRRHKIEDFWIFTIDRHPYDWLLSTILYDNSSYNRSGCALSERNSNDVNSAAKNYLRRPGVDQKINWPMYAQGDRILVNRVFRYEGLREELAANLLDEFIPECNIAEMPELKTNKCGFFGESIFSDEVKREAQRVFAPVFRNLGYQPD